MKIFGHPWIESESFYVVSSKDNINQTPPNSTVFLGNLSDMYGFDFPKYCQKNSIGYAVAIESITEAIFANILGCKFAICNIHLAKELTPIAENYLFDMQILVNIETVENPQIIDELAKSGVDGVLYDAVFVKQ